MNNNTQTKAVAKGKARIPNTIIHNGKRLVCRVFETAAPPMAMPFDAGDACIDRYTIAFKGYRLSGYGMVYPYLACSDNPYHGFGQHGESKEFLTGKHLGKRVRFDSLNDDVKSFILSNI